MPDASTEKLDQFVAAFLGSQRRLYQFVHSLVPETSDAEDVLQDASLVMWKKFDEFEAGTNFYAWASRIAYFEILNFRRRKSPETLLFDPATFDKMAAEVESSSDWLAEIGPILEKCLAELRPEDRDLIERRYAPGMRGKELARQLGRPANSVYKSLGRIRQRLWQCITDALAAKRGGSP